MDELSLAITSPLTVEPLISIPTRSWVAIVPMVLFSTITRLAPPLRLEPLKSLALIIGVLLVP